MRRAILATALACLTATSLALATDEDVNDTGGAETAADGTGGETLADGTGDEPYERRTSYLVSGLIQGGVCGSHTQPIYESGGAVSWGLSGVRGAVSNLNANAGALAVLENSPTIHTWATGCCVALGHDGYYGPSSITYTTGSASIFNPPYGWTWATRASASHIVCFDAGQHSTR